MTEAQYLTVSEAMENLFGNHTRGIVGVDFEVRFDFHPSDLDADSRRRYEAAWRTLAEARQRRLF
jgi:hypothetical protein